MSDAGPRHSASWQSVRRDILRRDGYECQDCGEEVGARDNPNTRDAEVHHKQPVSDGGTDAPENLVTLCSRCHTRRYWDAVEPARCDKCGREFVSAHGVKVHQTHPNAGCKGEDDDD